MYPQFFDHVLAIGAVCVFFSQPLIFQRGDTVLLALIILRQVSELFTLKNEDLPASRREHLVKQLTLKLPQLIGLLPKCYSHV